MFALYLLAFIPIICADNVPVLMWSASRPLSDLPQTFTGNTIDSQTFHQSYLSPLSKEKDHVVVFLQDKLNINDFAKYADVYNPFGDGGAFKNIKSFMDDNFSVHIPGVKSPKVALDQLKTDYKGRQHVVKAASDVANLKLDDGSYLILIVLPSNQKAATEEKAFTASDNIVGDVVKELKKRSVKYTAVYTGQSSKPITNNAVYSGRHLLAAETNTSIFINVTNDGVSMYLYARGITFYIITKTESFNLTMPYDSSAYKYDDSSIGNSTGVLSVEFPDVKDKNTSNTYDFSFKFHLMKSQDQRMKIENFTVSFKNVSSSSMIYDDEIMDSKSAELDLPSMFSYHCSAFKIFQLNKTDDATALLNMDGFQFQAFSIFNDEFGQSWDCVPYFTTAIWMGLFYGVIFIFILYYGMYMMFGLSTMDRFDDPKGKTITVNVSD